MGRRICGRLELAASLPISGLNATYDADCQRAGQMTVADALSEWRTIRLEHVQSTAGTSTLSVVFAPILRLGWINRRAGR